MSVAEFSNTQFGNLKVASTNIELLNNYFLATFRYDIDQRIYSHNGFVMFANNIENYNRMMDFCWDNRCLESTQGLYFAIGNAKQKITLERFIIGNTSGYAIDPKYMIFGLRTGDMMDPNRLRFKNFDCGIFNNLFFQPVDRYYGKCQRECDSGYYMQIDTQRCVKCHSDCLTCNGPASCTTCRSRFVLISGKCFPCQLPCNNCDEHPNKCLSCQKDAMFNPATSTCDKLCIDKKGCLNCDINTGKCLECETEYEIYDNKCKPKACELANCALCSADQKECKACNPGYVVVGRSCVVCFFGCTACPTGYLLESGICVAKKFAKLPTLLILTFVLLYSFL